MGCHDPTCQTVAVPADIKDPSSILPLPGEEALFLSPLERGRPRGGILEAAPATQRYPL
jgi:hypothetical protein